MASSVFPVAVASTGPNSYSSTVATANLQYKAVQSLSAGIYTITTTSTGSQATITFYGSTGASFATATTSSGTLTYNLASPASGYYIQIDTGSNIIVSLALTGNSVTGTQLSGTLDTITTSGTYNQTGLLYVLACAGGAGGAGGGAGGAGGAGGSIASGFVVANGPTTVTIGAAGNGGTANTVGNSGGQTSFGNLVVAPFAGGPGGGAGGNNTRNANGGLGTVVSGSITNGTNAGGTGGGANNTGSNIPGRVGGFGTGGTGGDGAQGAPGNAQAGGAASGYGAGGGGAGLGNTAQAGGAGTAGVIYVLRGI
jgi:hypothetical protein